MVHIIRVGVCHSSGANFEGRLQVRNLYGGLPQLALSAASSLHAVQTVIIHTILQQQLHLQIDCSCPIRGTLQDDPCAKTLRCSTLAGRR